MRFTVIWYIFAVQVAGQYQFMFPVNITLCEILKLLKKYQPKRQYNKELGNEESLRFIIVEV